MSNPFRKVEVGKEQNQLFSNFEQSGDRTMLGRGEFQSPNYAKQRRGWKINSEGDAEFQKIFIGTQLITLAPGDSLQNAIDDLNAIDGGKIFLQAGTYTVDSVINIKSSIQIEGENTSTTIIDFNSTNGQFKAAGTDVYSTGTITSIASGVMVTGSGTSWLGNVTTDHQLFIGNSWYKISAVTGDTTLVLAEGYAGGATFPGASYRVAKIIKDIEVRDLTIKNSTNTAIVLDDVRNIFLEDMSFITNNKGFVMNNCSEIDIKSSLIASSTSNGLEFNTCGYVNLSGLSVASNGGHGWVLNNVRLGSMTTCSSDANTSDGFNITSVTNVEFIVKATSNGGQGMEFVSNNTGCFVHNAVIESNTSDGIKLTATSDDTIISNSQINSNGGYGINIAASTDDNTIITTNKFASNSSGAINDSGTGTVIRGNVGVTDNTSSALVANVQTFTSDDTWTKPSGANRIFVQAWGAGGGGGGADGGANAANGGGGGGGSYVEGWFNASSLAATVAITVGTGGTGGVGNADGSIGEDSTFGTHITAYGGGGGAGAGTGEVGGGGGGGGFMSAGSSSTDTTGASGGDPVGGAAGVASSMGGGGGGSGTPAAGALSAYGGGGGGGGGNGGRSHFGGGGGAGGSGTQKTGGTSVYGGAGGNGGVTQANGSNGTVPSGGGGGGASDTGGAAQNGGNGAAGKIIVATYF